MFTRFLADARVIGPEYPSCDVSEGVGDGEITLGVAGISREGIIWSKVGSAQQGATPTIARRIFRSCSMLYVEWSWVSSVVRFVIVAVGGAIGSSGAIGAEQGCAAFS